MTDEITVRGLDSDSQAGEHVGSQSQSYSLLKHSRSS